MSPWNPARMPGADGPGTAKAYGSNPRRQERDFGRVFTGLLFALFVATLLMAILVGTGVYRVLHQEGAVADNQRLSLTLLANDVRANDQIDAVARAWVTEDAVSVEVAGADGFEAAAAAEDGRSLFQGPALVLRETLPSGVYETRLYRYDGTIMEEYAHRARSMRAPRRWPCAAGEVSADGSGKCPPFHGRLLGGLPRPGRGGRR